MSPFQWCLDNGQSSTRHGSGGYKLIGIISDSKDLVVELLVSLQLAFLGSVSDIDSSRAWLMTETSKLVVKIRQGLPHGLHSGNLLPAFRFQSNSRC